MSAAEPDPSGTDIHRLARGGTLNLAGGVTAGLLGFLLVVVVTRGLGPAGAGEFFESIGVFTILTGVVQFGANTGMVRTISRLRALDRVGEVRSVIAFGLVPVLTLGAAVACALFLTAPAVARALHGTQADDVARYLRMLAPFLPLAAGSAVALSGTRGFGTMIPYVALESVGKPLLRPLAVLVAIAAGFGATGVALAWASPLAIQFPVAVAILYVLLGRTDEGRASSRPAGQIGSTLTEFWRFAAPRGLASVFQVSVLWLDVLLVGALRGAREAGVYAAVSRLVLVGTFAIEAVRLVIAPQLSALLAREDRQGAEELYQTATWWLMGLSWPAYILVGVFASTVLRIFGPEFASGEVPLVILTGAMLANMGTGNVTVVLLMGGKSSWNLLNTVAALTVNVTLNLVLIPRLGMSGAAIAWASSILVENAAALFQVRSLLGLRPFGQGYRTVAIETIVAFACVGLIARAVLGDSIPGLLACAGAGGALYVTRMWRSRDTLRLPMIREAMRYRNRRRARAEASEGQA